MSNKWVHRPKPKARPADAESGTVNGVVDSVVFHSEDTGYTVCSVKLPGEKDSVTVVGNCPAIWVGENLEAVGHWTRHQRHGYQFQADSVTCVPPTSARGIERYLASGMIRGIGKVNAKRIVSVFGKDTLRVIEKESVRLEEVEGIGPGRRKMIRDSWIEQFAVRDIMIFLQGHGIGTAQSARIYRHYGNDSVNKIRENPYRLCAEIWGIGFKTADSVATSVGIPRDSEVRARAGLVYVLRTMAEEGHCFCNEGELILLAQDLLDIPAEILEEALNIQVRSGAVIRDDGRIYLQPLYQAEVGVAEKIRLLMHTKPLFHPIVVEKAIPWAEKKMHMEFAPMQVEALSRALQSKVSIITGGPGVGKTTIIRALVDVYVKRGLRVLLAAPTGRAAKRMEESTGREAKTIHRLLKYQPRTASFEHGPIDPLEGDVFILDEVSMMDIQLMYSFLSALPDQACLVLVGDVDQLPSVGPGNVLRDLISSRKVPCEKLETIFRQQSGGAIVYNAHRVNKGESLEVDPTDELSDFYFIQADEPEQVLARVLDLVSSRIPERFRFDSMTDIQVLTPMRKNQLGAENLNALLQQRLNPAGPELSRFGRKYRLGDRVMQIRNNYDKEVFNGDIGHIVKVDKDELVLYVDYDGRRVLYESNALDELVHAYACSIHKSQGSEYPAVVILLATQHYKLLQRNLLYTAITRGRKLVCLVGSTKAVRMAIRNNEIRMRKTGLADRMSE